MDREAVAASLKRLATDPRRPKAAQLRDVIEHVEAALAAGVSRSLVLQELKSHGLEMTLATFETTLRRIRAKRRAPGPRAPTSPAATPPPTSAPPPATHRPSDLDGIIGQAPDLDSLVKHARRNRP